MQPRATPEALGLVETEYHRLYRAEISYRWWRPLLMLLLSGVFLLLASGAVLAVAQFIASLVAGRSVGILEMQAYLIPDTQQPMSMLLALSTIAIGIPCVFFAMWCVGIKPVGRISSVALRIRWGLLMRMLWPAVAALLFMQIASIVFNAVFPVSGEELAPVEINVQAALISVAIILVLVPLQSAAEEYLFRGVLMQTIGSWVRNPALAIILPTLLFMSMHIYDIWGLLQVGVMGLVAGWLAWRTGGLEAAIMIHVINNLVVFLFMASGITGETGQTEEGGNLPSLVIVSLGLIGYAWLAVRIFDRKGYARVMRAEPPAPQFQPGVFPGGNPGAYPGTYPEAQQWPAQPGVGYAPQQFPQDGQGNPPAALQPPALLEPPRYGERIDPAVPAPDVNSAVPQMPAPEAAVPVSETENEQRPEDQPPHSHSPGASS